MRSTRKTATLVPVQVERPSNCHNMRRGGKVTIEGLRYTIRRVYGLDEHLGMNPLSEEGGRILADYLRDQVVARATLTRLWDGQGMSICEFMDGSFSWPEDLGYKIALPETRGPVTLEKLPQPTNTEEKIMNNTVKKVSKKVVAATPKVEVKQIKPVVQVEPPKSPRSKAPEEPLADNLGDNWLLRRFVNLFIAKGNRPLRAHLLNCSNRAELKKVYLERGGTEVVWVENCEKLLEKYS